MNTVVLGANGKLGTLLGHYSRQAGLDWRAQARETGHDITWSGHFDDPACNAVFQRGATLINMIGATGGGAETLQRVNVTFVERLLERAAQAGVAHVILASSAAVYGSSGSGVFHETSSLDGTSPYALSKIAMEQAARNVSNDPSGLKVTIARIGNVAGADMLIDSARTHSTHATPLRLHRFPDGSAPVRSYVSPHDLFRVLRDLAETPNCPSRIVNVAHPQPVALDELVLAYQRHLFSTLKIEDTPAPPTALRRVELATDELRTLTQFATHADPADALAFSVAEYRREVSTQ